MSAEKSKRRKDKEHCVTMGFGCYGMPIGLKIIITKYADVMKESKRLRPCKECIRTAQRVLAEEMRRAFSQMREARDVNS